ncbi:MAG: hypothetical protein ACXVBG_24080, partial [Isosphaeraceae bacterium]
ARQARDPEHHLNLDLPGAVAPPPQAEHPRASRPVGTQGFGQRRRDFNADYRGPKLTYNLDTPTRCFPRKALARCR